jgi:hypothetical protein
MKAVELIGDVDHERRLSATVPETMTSGPVRVIVTDQPGGDWMRAIANEWAEELADPREDLYTLLDGEPIDVAR